MFPGYDGGMEWGGGAVDPRGTYYVNVNEIPWLYGMVPTRGPGGEPLSLGERGYLIQCGACHGADRRGDPGSGFPSLVDLGSRRSEAQVTAVLDAGGARMPSFRELEGGQKRAIVDWLFGKEQPAAAYAQPGRGGSGRVGGGGVPIPLPSVAPYASAGFRKWLDAEGYPAIKPPWGTLSAVDLNTGELKWKVPLGEYRELTARGIPPTGTETYGGPVVTATGLLFIAATADETIRAFDTDTGKLLWEARLPFGGNATPSTYSVNGRQFLVISAGGGKSRRPAGGMVVAFSLPDRAPGTP
jgi:quinoprotein glucose dehydrogenase